MADPAAAVPAANGADPHLNAVVEHLRAVAADMSRRVEMGSEDAAALLSEYDRRGTELVEAQRAKVSWSHSLRSQEIRVQQFRTERANLWKILGRPDGSGTSVELCDAVADERDARRRFQQDAAEREARLVAVRALAADAVAAWKAEGLNGEPCVGAVSIRAALGGTTDTPPPPAASEWELQMRGFLGKRVEVVLNEDPRKVVVGVLHGFDTDGQVRLVDEDGSWGWAWPCLDIAEAPAVSPREDETPEPPPADTAALCCDCMCEHQCTKDPTVIGHQGCFACKWCSCRAHAVSPPPADDGTFGLRTALGDDETARLIRRQRETARQYFQMDVVARQTAWLVEHGYEEASDA